MKEEALDRTMWRNRFGRFFGPVVWQITDDDDDCIGYLKSHKVYVYIPEESVSQSKCLQ